MVGSANDDVMEDVIVSFAAVKDRELDSKLFFAERFKLIVDEVPVFRDFTCGIRIEHDLSKHNFIQRLIVLRRQQDRRNTVLASAA